ncbi:hypothetical protein J3R82DRAFT_2035 [Butyriboletus roseoflavus]|nr:hypothetical protein J3R82DRAFT_2035 [Butyriboletus roseoflavus]
MVLRDEDQTLLSGKQKSGPSKLFFRNWIIPAIMLAQISMFIFAWTFAGSMMHKTIQLPDSTATWIQNNPSDTNVIVTLISTVLALTSSFLLGKAVQHALVRRLLYRPLRLHTMVEWAKLAQRSVSVNFDRCRLSWTLLSVVWVSLLGFLTTAWSSLLAPESVVIYYDWQSNETNIVDPSASYLFSNQVGVSQPLPQFNLTPWTTPFDGLSLGDLAGGLMDAGLAAAGNVSLTKHTTNFINVYLTEYVSNISTGGIFPTCGLASWPYFPSDVNPLYQGLSTTYNTTQHGFTANISCRTPTSNDPVITPNQTDSVQINSGDYYSWAIDTYSWSTNCSSEIEYSTMGVSVASGMVPGGDNKLPGENGLFMTSVCFGQGFAGSSNESFLVLFDSQNNSSYYSFTPQICEVTPLVTTVQATCDQTDIINVTLPPLDQQPLPDPTSANSTTMMLWVPALTIWATFVRSQGLASSTMGDDLLGLFTSPVEFNPVIENYLRGMIEYLGTAMAVLSLGGSPTVPFYGTMNVHTFGWTFHLRTHGPSLTAITAVTALTLAAGAFAMMPIDRYDGASKKLQAATAHSFDPTQTMDVLLASTAGDLARVLSESDCDNRHRNHDTHGHDEDLRIVLGITEKGRPALRTMDVVPRDSHSSRDKVRLVADEDFDSADVANRDGFIELGDLEARTERVD